MFLVGFSLIFVNDWGWGAVNESAASAAFPDYVKFQAVIKSAASAASRQTKIQESRGASARRLGVIKSTSGAASFHFGHRGGSSPSHYTLGAAV